MKTQFYIVLVVLLFDSSMGAQVSEFKLDEREHFSLNWGRETEDGYFFSVRLRKDSLSPVYFYGTRYVDSDRNEVYSRPEVLLLAVSSNAHAEFKIIAAPIEGGAQDDVRVILVTETLVGADDLYDLSLSKATISEAIEESGYSGDDVVMVKLGFGIYEKFPGCSSSKKPRKYLFSEPLHFTVDDQGRIKLLGHEYLGNFISKVGEEFGFRFGPLPFK